MTRLPVLFISHGMPVMAIRPGPTGEFLRSLGRKIPRPSAILCISAHWETVRPMATGAARPETIHDFGGFARELHAMRYPAPGAPELAERTVGMLAAAGMDARIDPERGLDHGAWVPLSLMFPAADVPVFQLSFQGDMDGRHHVSLGRALAPLRDEGVLILGSGGATHNLEAMQGRRPDEPPLDAALAFDEWLADAVARGRTDEIARFREIAPDPDFNHPYPSEHFLPLPVAVGAAGEGCPGRRIHRAFLYGALSLSAFAWD